MVLISFGLKDVSNVALRLLRGQMLSSKVLKWKAGSWKSHAGLWKLFDCLRGVNVFYR